MQSETIPAERNGATPIRSILFAAAQLTAVRQ
jgi:hypothetical protein